MRAIIDRLHLNSRYKIGLGSFRGVWSRFETSSAFAPPPSWLEASPARVKEDRTGFLYSKNGTKILEACGHNGAGRRWGGRAGEQRSEPAILRASARLRAARAARLPTRPRRPGRAGLCHSPASICRCRGCAPPEISAGAILSNSVGLLPRASESGDGPAVSGCRARPAPGGCRRGRHGARNPVNYRRRGGMLPMLFTGAQWTCTLVVRVVCALPSGCCRAAGWGMGGNRRPVPAAEAGAKNPLPPCAA